MIDLHCHLLPAIDDGPDTLQESLELARMAVADGIEECVLTPHIHPGRFSNDRERIGLYVQAFQGALQREAIPLRVHAGAELRVSVEALEMLVADQVPFIGADRGVSVVLLELPHSHIPVGCLRLIERMLNMNIRPLIAHPERNKAIMDDTERIRPFLAAGCWLQLTAGSLTGDFGREAQRVSYQLLDEDLVHVVATDAHNQRSRPPRLSAARDWISQHWGHDLAEDLLVNHPKHILHAH